MKRFDFQV